MKLHRRRFLHLSAGGSAVIASLTRGASAQDAYPSRPIRLIVGFSPGAASDITGRLFAQGAGPVLGQQVAVENKPGAAGSIAGHTSALTMMFPWQETDSPWTSPA